MSVDYDASQMAPRMAISIFRDIEVDISSMMALS